MTKPTIRKKLCPECGAEMDGSNCTECGYDETASEETEEEETSEEKTEGW